MKEGLVHGLKEANYGVTGVSGDWNKCTGFGALMFFTRIGTFLGFGLSSH